MVLQPGYVYVYVFIYIYMFIYIYIYVFIYICLFIYIYIYIFQNEIYDIWTEILFPPLISHSSTQKAPPDELLVRIVMTFSVDYESVVKTQCSNIFAE